MGPRSLVCGLGSPRRLLLRALNFPNQLEGDGFVLLVTFREYREVSVNRNTATATQTLKEAPGVENPAGNLGKTTKNPENPQKLRDPAPTYGVSVSAPLP